MISKSAPPPGGKTYTLSDSEESSDKYYRQISRLTDELICAFGGIEALLAFIQESGKRFGRIGRFLGSTKATRDFLETLRRELSRFTTEANTHVRLLSIRNRFNKTLSMREPAYHLAMIEIELLNRTNIEAFHRADRKIALLPHCLRDLEASCKSVKHGIDYVCKNCSKSCDVNTVSKKLRRHSVEPYLWMTASLRSLIRTEIKAGRTLGVLGVACIPELAHGMRRCMAARIPVIGLPLDANRCARWWGEFYPNSVNLSEMERLLTDPG